MKKIIVLLVGILFAYQGFAQPFAQPEFNMEVTRNDRKVGGIFEVKVQVRNATGTLLPTFYLGNFNFRFLYNRNALRPHTDRYGDTTQILPPPFPATIDTGCVEGILLVGSSGGTYSWPFATSYVDNNVGTDPTRLFSLNGIWQGSGGAAELGAVIGQGTWVDLATIAFIIRNNTTEKMMISYEPYDHQAGNTVVTWGAEAPPTLENNVTNVGTNLGAKHDKVTYNGTSWFGGNGSNGMPDASDASKELIVSGGTAQISGEAEVEYIEVNAGTLEMLPNSSMRPFNQSAGNYVTTNSTFLLKAGTDNTNDKGSGAQYWGPQISGTVEQNVGEDADGNANWTNMSFPAAGGAITPTFATDGGGSANASPDAFGSWGNFVASTEIFSFPSGHEWIGLSGLPSGGTADGYHAKASGVVSASGTLNGSGSFSANYEFTKPHVFAPTPGSGSQSIVDPLQINPGGLDTSLYRDNWNGWVLVGNPFTTGLDVTAFTTGNGIAAANLAIFDKTNISDTNGASFGYPAGNYSGAGSVIPPMQGFWIKFGSAGDGPQSLTFDETMQTFTQGSYLKTLPDHYIDLSLKNVTTTAEAKVEIAFDNGANKGYDLGLDGYVISTPGNGVPKMGIVDVNTNGNRTGSYLALNYVPMPFGTSESYELQTSMRSAGIHEFSLDNTLLDNGWRVYIEDLQEDPGVYYEITNAKFSFTSSPSVDMHKRFVLHFSPNGQAVSVEENGVNANWNAAAWFNDRDELVVRIEGFDAPQTADIQVIDMAGNLILRTDGSKGETVIPATVASGMYVVNVISTENHDTKNIKVIKPE